MRFKTLWHSVCNAVLVDVQLICQWGSVSLLFVAGVITMVSLLVEPYLCTNNAIGNMNISKGIDYEIVGA